MSRSYTAEKQKVLRLKIYQHLATGTKVTRISYSENYLHGSVH